MILRLVFLTLIFALPAHAEEGDFVVPDLPAADIYVLGEVHDNPHHHLTQAALISRLNPAAVVFEMLTSEQAALVRSTEVADPEALDWTDSGWPDFGLYAPVFEAAEDRAIYGAQITRDQARAAMRDGLVASFNGVATRFGLTKPVPPDQLDARLALQDAAHCGAMPPEMLPMMVEIQRLRDAELARSALEALDTVGGPVVVITGNGHARSDWGVPAMIRLARPATVVTALGQTEDDQPPQGPFDLVVSAPAVDRPDPCAIFQ